MSILLFISVLCNGQVTFIIETLPQSTPLEDTIFIAGSFNNWSTNDPNYMLQAQIDGKYTITLPRNTGTIEFKFCRGSWMKVETGKANQFIPNRKYTFGNDETVYVKVDNWQDAGGIKQTNYMLLFFFASACLGLFIIFLISRVPRLSILKFKGFLLCNTFIIIMFYGSFIYNEASLIWKSYLFLLAQCVLFAWGPSILAYITAIHNNKLPSKLLLHYIPVVFILAINVLRVINIHSMKFMAGKLKPHFSYVDLVIVWLSIIYNLIYCVVIIKSIEKISIHKKEEGSIAQKFVLTLSIISAISLILFVMDNVFVFYGIGGNLIVNHELAFLTLSLIIYFEIYIILRHQDVFKEQSSYLTDEKFSNIKGELEKIMCCSKPYINPELNIADLSDMLNTKPHILSKLLNDHFNKSFRDYINEYRVAEFIKLAKLEEYKKYTFLALAHEVGFNSKSTFNLAFKKNTKRTPREYFKVDS